MTTLQDRPSYRLTRHFLGELFDLGFLSDEGTLSFTRLIIGICATFLSVGLLLVRVYLSKYAYLAMQGTPEPYRQTVLADHAFLIALPMWVVAFATVLIGHALFPDETDFRVLMPLPIARRLIFTAKLLALLLFTGLFIAFAQIALVPAFLLMSLSRWAEGAFLLRAGSYAAASLMASGFAVLAVVAMHGLLLVATPRQRALSASAALRSVMLFALMLSLPVVARLPAQVSSFAAGASWLRFSPPAWFVGVEQYLLGRPRAHFVHLAQIAAFASTLAAGVAIGTYAVIYRHFDRVILRSAVSGGSAIDRDRANRRRRRDPRRRVFAAIRSFTLITLRRSVLHQGIVVVVSAIGVGLVANSFSGSGVLASLAEHGTPPRRVIDSVIWAPFALMYVVSRGVRAALLVPIEQRANWIFRITERDVFRVDQLDAAVHTVRLLGVIVPIALLSPFEWLVLGARSASVLVAALICGWLYVELLMKEWARIPFTCSYIPGKRFVPHTMLIGLSLFLGFTMAGAGVARLNVWGGPAAIVCDITLLSLIVVLRWRRLNGWRHLPLEFEDSLPTEVNPLTLTER